MNGRFATDPKSTPEVTLRTTGDTAEARRDGQHDGEQGRPPQPPYEDNRLMEDYMQAYDEAVHS
jgi:hypothetical protein